MGFRNFIVNAISRASDLVRVERFSRRYLPKQSRGIGALSVRRLCIKEIPETLQVL
jgi:hypothetical protein